MSDNTHIINPESGRTIMKGGKIHRKLMKTGKMPNEGFKKIEKEVSIKEGPKTVKKEGPKTVKKTKKDVEQDERIE